MHRFYFVLIVILGFGCSSRPVFYQSEPLTTIVPDQAGELQVDGFATFNTDVTGLGTTVLYGLTDHIALGGHFRQIGRTTEVNAEFDYKGLLHSYGLKLGYSHPISTRISFNLMADYDQQHQQFYFTEIRAADMRSNIAALQACVSMRSGRFHLGYGLRLNRIHYIRSRADVSMPPDYLREIESLNQDPTLFFPELGIDVGYLTNRLNLRLGLINRFNNLNNNHFLNGTVMLSAGYNFQLRKMENQKQ